MIYLSFYFFLIFSLFYFFFFLMIRRPPRSTLFPTRRSSDLQERLRNRSYEGIPAPLTSGAGSLPAWYRSEEHTSELQSREISYAVFCLKKKKTKTENKKLKKMKLHIPHNINYHKYF